MRKAAVNVMPAGTASVDPFTISGKLNSFRIQSTRDCSRVFLKEYCIQEVFNG
jgi:hypothetical protein